MTAPYSTWTWRVGSTEPIEFQLTADGEAVDLSGVTSVEIRLRAGDLAPSVDYDTVTNPTKLAITDATEGKVTFYPGAAEFALVEGHYNAFFWVTDGAGRIASYPTGANFVIRVLEAF